MEIVIVWAAAQAFREEHITTKHYQLVATYLCACSHQ